MAIMTAPSYTSANHELSFFNLGNDRNLRFFYLGIVSNNHSSYTGYYSTIGQNRIMMSQNYIYIDDYFSLNPFFLASQINVKENFNDVVADALKRYKLLNNNSIYDTSPVVGFLSALKLLYQKYKFFPYLIFTQSGAKAEFDYNGRHFVFNYDYDDRESVIILCDTDGAIDTQECLLDNLEKVFETF
jgi:hypothetical protein